MPDSVVLDIVSITLNVGFHSDILYPRIRFERSTPMSLTRDKYFLPQAVTFSQTDKSNKMNPLIPAHDFGTILLGMKPEYYCIILSELAAT